MPASLVAAAASDIAFGEQLSYIAVSIGAAVVVVVWIRLCRRWFPAHEAVFDPRDEHDLALAAGGVWHAADMALLHLMRSGHVRGDDGRFTWIGDPERVMGHPLVDAIRDALVAIPGESQLALWGAVQRRREVREWKDSVLPSTSQRRRPAWMAQAFVAILICLPWFLYGVELESDGVVGIIPLGQVILGLAAALAFKRGRTSHPAAAAWLERMRDEDDLRARMRARDHSLRDVDVLRLALLFGTGAIYQYDGALAAAFGAGPRSMGDTSGGVPHLRWQD